MPYILSGTLKSWVAGLAKLSGTIKIQTRQ